MQNKLLAKNKRYREILKNGLEGQLGIFNPGQIPDAEKLMASQESFELTGSAAGEAGAKTHDAGTRNAAGSLEKGGKGSVASIESAISLPDETKIKSELHKLAESEEEDDAFLSKVEKAQIVRLEAEKDDNKSLKRQMTNL